MNTGPELWGFAEITLGFWILGRFLGFRVLGLKGFREARGSGFRNDMERLYLEVRG